MPFNAFISYSHQQTALAHALKDALHRFAKPWYRLRALRVFLDEASLGANAGLRSALDAALDQAEYFILIASPAAASSSWVPVEIARWIEARGKPERMIILLAEGEIHWSAEQGDFDWSRTTALPRAPFERRFGEEPTYVDLRWTAGQVLTLRDPHFRAAVADVAAPLHHRDRDAIESDDLSQHRRTLLVAWTAAVALAVLAAIAGVSALAAGRQRDVARREAENARQRLMHSNIGSGNHLLDDGDGTGALLWFAEAAKLARPRSPEERLARTRLAVAARQMPRLAAMWFERQEVDRLVVGEDGHRAVAYLRDSGAQLLDLRADPPGQVVPLDGRVLDVLLEHEPPLVLTAEAGPLARVRAPSAPADALVVQPDGVVHDACFTRGGRYLVTASAGTVQRWRLADGQPAGALPGASAFLFCSPREEVVLAASPDGTVRRWNTRDGSVVELALSAPPRVLDLSADGRYILTVTEGTAAVWSAATGGKVSTLGDFEGVTNAVFSPDAHHVMMSTWSGWLQGWDLDGPAENRDSPLPTNAVALSWRGDGKRFVVGLVDNTARLFAAERITPVPPSLWHEDTVSQAFFTPDGARLITATAPGTLRLWDLDPRAAATLLRHPGSDLLTGIDVSPDGARVLTRTHGEVRIWTVGPGGGGDPVVLRPDSQIYEARFDPDGARVVTGTEDRLARLWDARTGRQLLQLAHPARVNGAVFAQGGALLLTASGTQIGLWNATTGQRLGTLENRDDQYSLTRLTVARDLVLAESFGGDLRVWSLPARRELSSLHRSNVDRAALSPDGARIAAASGKTVTVFDSRSGATLATVPRGRYALARLVFSADGARIAIGDQGGATRIWEVRTGAALTPPLLHNAAIDDLAFSPDGSLIATASADNTARLWDAATGEPVTPPLPHRDSVIAAAFTPDGQRLLTASVESVGRLWEVGPSDRPLEEQVAAAQTLAARRIDDTGAMITLTAAELERRWRSRPTPDRR
jgi:WD40 repeat protein